MGIERTQETDRRAGADEYSREMTKIAVAQICEKVGVQQIKESTLESLTDIVVQYIFQLGKSAISYASLSGRTQCNLLDIVLGLEDLTGGELGFESGNDCAMNSAKLKEIGDYVNSSGENEVPFAQPFPKFPVVVDDANKKRRIPSFAVMGETPPSKHIPEWLPAFPDPHTYKDTPVWVERASDPRGDKIEQAKQRRKAERALLNLQQRLVCNGSNLTSAWGQTNHGKEQPREAETKPKVVLELESAEKDELVNANKGSVLEAFGPAMEAAKDGYCDDGERKVKRARAVQFKLRTRKKLLTDPLELSLQKKGEGKGVPSVREDERDDKRRRAEFILRQCIENPMDLNQL